MTSYKNLAGNVGVCAYEIGEKQIRIKFHTHKSVVFEKHQTEEQHYNTIQQLATQGFGLHQYLSDEMN